VPETVHLESEQVLRAAYRVPRRSALRASKQVLGLPAVRRQRELQSVRLLLSGDTRRIRMLARDSRQ